MDVLTISIKHCTRDANWYYEARRKIKGIRIRREDINLSLFEELISDDCIDNPK